MFYFIAVFALFAGFYPVFGQEERSIPESREERAIEDLISDFETHLHFYYLLALGSLHETYVTGKISVKKDVYIHQTIFLAKEIGSREIKYRKDLPPAYNLFRDFGSFHSICRKLIFNNTEFDAEHKAYCSSTEASYSRGRLRVAGNNSGCGFRCVMAEFPRNYSPVSYYSSRKKSRKRFEKYLENIQTMYAYKKRVEQDLDMLKEAISKSNAPSTP